MHLCKKKNIKIWSIYKKTQTQMRRDVSLGSVLFALLPTFLVTVDNIKSYMNQDDHLVYFINRRLTLKGVLEQIMPSYITPSKVRIRHIRIAFQHTSCIQETFRTGIKRSHTFGANFYANAFFRTGCYTHDKYQLLSRACP